jgi:hypothetical protein
MLSIALEKLINSLWIKDRFLIEYSDRNQKIVKFEKIAEILNVLFQSSRYQEGKFIVRE